MSEVSKYREDLPAVSISRLRALDIMTAETTQFLVRLGHAEQNVTEIYNRYAYVKEMRKVLTQWANELLATEKMHYVCADSSIIAEYHTPAAGRAA